MEKLECDGSWWSFLFLLSAPHGGFIVIVHKPEV